MRRFGYAAIAAALVSLASGPGAAASRAVTNLPDGRMLAVIGDGGAQSVTSINGAHRIVAGGIVIEFVDGRLTVDGEPRKVPAFETLLEIRIANGEVTLTGDP